MQEINSPKFVNCRMYAHWREREHEDIDFLVDEDPVVTTVLAQCGLLKLFQCSFMWAQPGMLNAFFNCWHLDAEVFILEG
jgi:hypothetical protein